MSPTRIQRQRTKGWRMPEGAVYVGRPSAFGNPFSIGPDIYRNEIAVRLYREQLTAAIERPWGPAVICLEFRIMADRLPRLRGRDLACWCPLDVPCHADVLLELANR
jgi:hypothetical protein